MTLTIVMLAYKEAENLKFIIPKIVDNMSKTKIENYSILVVDGNPTQDNTRDICTKFKKCTYVNQKYPSFGGALKTAIEMVNTDLFLILDADGSHNPEYIPSLIDKYLETNCDVVIGSRYIKGGTTDDKLMNKFFSKTICIILRILFGIKAKDISGGFRLYRTDKLKQINLECQHYNIQQEILLKIKIKYGKIDIKEVPIHFEKRYAGKTKRKLVTYFSFIKSTIKLFFLRIKGKID